MSSSSSSDDDAREQPLLAMAMNMMTEEDANRCRLLDHREKMEVMFWQEVAHYRTSDYLVAPNNLSMDVNFPSLCCDREGVMNEQWRTRMCEWAYQLVDHFDFPRYIVGTCMNFLDRYLESYFCAVAAPDGLPRIHKRQFQLVTMACLYLAMKLRGPHTRIPIAYMVQLSRGTVTEHEMVAMEKELLSRLSWLVNPPTSHDFLKHYVQLLQPLSLMSNQNALTDPPKSPRLTALEDLASFLVELSVLDYYFINVRPSTIALAALLNAMDEDPRLVSAAVAQHGTTNPFSQHTYYHGYEGLILPGEEEGIHLARQRLGSLYSNAGGGAAVADEDAVQEPGSPAPTHNKDGTRITSPVSVVPGGGGDNHLFQQ